MATGAVQERAAATARTAGRSARLCGTLLAAGLSLSLIHI